MNGGTVNPHFYPLIKKDVHLFDGEIFPEFRGRRLNPLFVDYMLSMFKNKGMERAFIEMREWNEANRRSIGKTSFHNIGVARKINVFGRNVVIWSKW